MTSKNLIDSNSVVLVSGGGRGITARCVVELAAQARCKFILLGRTIVDYETPSWASGVSDEAELKRRIIDHLRLQSQTPTPQKVQAFYRDLKIQREVEKTLTGVKRAGGVAEYVSVDITNLLDLEIKLAGPVSRLGKITGVIHGAGDLADKRIERKTIDDFEKVFSPKVDGLENLLHIAPPSQLAFLVLFSSVVGVYGNVGQADYAIANEILNKTALLLRANNPDCHVVSFNWGPWEAGMVSPELKKAFEARGIEVIPLDAGAKLLVRELMPYREQGPAQVVVGKFAAQPPEPLSTELNQFSIHRRLRLDSNPFLFDHKIGENPVLPATCSATWIANACEQLYPGLKFFSLSNYQVLKGIVFDRKAPDQEFILELKETAKTPNMVKFQAAIISRNAKGQPVFHYKADVTLVAELPQAPIATLPEVNSPGDLAAEGVELYQDGILFHGPSFQGVDKVLHISRERLVMQLKLPCVEDRIQGQFPVQNRSNPYIYDAIVQILLIWTQVYHKAPCLPSSLETLEQFRNIPFDQPCLVTMQIRSNSETSVVGDILAQSETGEVYVRFKELQGTISPMLNRYIGVKGKAENQQHETNRK